MKAEASQIFHTLSPAMQSVVAFVRLLPLGKRITDFAAKRLSQRQAQQVKIGDPILSPTSQPTKSKAAGPLPAFEDYIKGDIRDVLGTPGRMDQIMEALPIYGRTITTTIVGYDERYAW